MRVLLQSFAGAALVVGLSACGNGATEGPQSRETAHAADYRVTVKEVAAYSVVFIVEVFSNDTSEPVTVLDVRGDLPGLRLNDAYHPAQEPPKDGRPLDSSPLPALRKPVTVQPHTSESFALVYNVDDCKAAVAPGVRKAQFTLVIDGQESTRFFSLDSVDWPKQMTQVPAPMASIGANPPC